jgi:membrane fusion protein (multidrug efflux system)
VRYALTTLLVLAVLGALVAVKGAQFQVLAAAGERGEKDGPPPEFVGAATSKAARWDRTIDAVGSVTSARGVALTSEVPGEITRIAFESGDKVKRGATVVELDSSVERAQLASALADRNLAELSAKRSSTLAAQGSLSQAALEETQAQLETAIARVDGLRAQLAKKTVRAPFDGRLGIRAVNLGQYITPGTTIATLESIDEAFVDFTLPQEQLDQAPPGTPVRITYGASGSRRTVDGEIVAIDPAVSASTRSAQLRARVPNADWKLRSGMFVDVSVILPAEDELVVVPMTAIVHAPYGDSVFVVADKPKDEPGMRTTPDGKKVQVARQQFVRTGVRQGDFVAVLEGLRADTQVVMSGAFKLRNGAPIVVTDKAVPEAKVAPHPENR